MLGGSLQQVSDISSGQADVVVEDDDLPPDGRQVVDRGAQVETEREVVLLGRLVRQSPLRSRFASSPTLPRLVGDDRGQPRLSGSPERVEHRSLSPDAQQAVLHEVFGIVTGRGQRRGHAQHHGQVRPYPVLEARGGGPVAHSHRHLTPHGVARPLCPGTHAHPLLLRTPRQRSPRPEHFLDAGRSPAMIHKPIV